MQVIFIREFLTLTMVVIAHQIVIVLCFYTQIFIRIFLTLTIVVIAHQIVIELCFYTHFFKFSFECIVSRHCPSLNVWQGQCKTEPLHLKTLFTLVFIKCMTALIEP